MRTLRHLLSFAITSVASAFALAIGAVGILDNPHNLSTSGGKGEHGIKSSKEQRVCIFCHTPHHSTMVMPLWSRDLSSVSNYVPYDSSTLKASPKPGQPTGSSRLCLSCHDGTIALGMLTGGYNLDPGLGSMPYDSRPTLNSNLQTDLSDDHPISFGYTSTLAANNGKLKDPSALPAVIKLEKDTQFLQCTSCHNPHTTPYMPGGKFLVIVNEKTGSALCVACHAEPGWDASTQKLNTATSADACMNCHYQHSAPGAKHLLKYAAEESNCLATCHNGSGNGINVKPAFDKLGSHPVASTTGIHDAAENPLFAKKHVECADCHSPHRYNSKDAPLSAPPAVNGRLTGIKGIDSSGVVVTESRYEYEICFKCHADNPFHRISATSPIRQIVEVNERHRFDPLNPSYHPVVEQGKVTAVPSLRSELNLTSRIYCTDCHNSDDGTKAGGSGANGPHGSVYPHLLIARYEDSYPLSYVESNYALCYRCHDPSILLDPARSLFPLHQSHVVIHQVSCSVCHDPHGVPAVRGATATNNSHLMNFDTRFAGLAASYTSTGLGRGNCTVSCHSSNPRSYP